MALRTFVMLLNQQGYEKQMIYNSLYALALWYQKNNQETNYEIIADVLDMLTGWYNGLNIEMK